MELLLFVFIFVLVIGCQQLSIPYVSYIYRLHIRRTSRHYLMINLFLFRPLLFLPSAVPLMHVVTYILSFRIKDADTTEYTTEMRIDSDCNDITQHKYGYQSGKSNSPDFMHNIYLAINSILLA